MALKLKRTGDTSYLQDHNLLKNTDLKDQHPIAAITGLQESLDDKDKRIDNIETKIENGEIGSGGGIVKPSSLKYVSNLEYEGTKLIKETFTGDINKVVNYTYENDNIIKKSVTKNNNTVEAFYNYDILGNLIKITDNGVGEVIVAGGSSTPGTDRISQQLRIIGDSTYSKITEIINYNGTITSNGLGAILNSELLITNSSNTETLILVVMQGETEITNVNIEPKDTQKYNLGTNSNTTISVKGSAKYEFTINGMSEFGSISDGGEGSADISDLIKRVILLEKNQSILSGNDKSLSDMLSATIDNHHNMENTISEMNMFIKNKHDVSEYSNTNIFESFIDSTNIDQLINCEVADGKVK